MDDVQGLIGMIMGLSIVLIPVIGFTARYAMKPLVEALGKAFQSHGTDESVRMLERRMVLLEQQIESMDTTVNRLADAAEFHRELQSGSDPVKGPAASEPRR